MNFVGSWNLQCNSEGKCQCKPGVTGDKCDRCDNNFYDFGQNGCKECGCSVAGSLENRASCNSTTGICSCKENVEGRQCSKYVEVTLINFEVEIFQHLLNWLVQFKFYARKTNVNNLVKNKSSTFSRLLSK